MYLDANVKSLAKGLIYNCEKKLEFISIFQSGI